MASDTPSKRTTESLSSSLFELKFDSGASAGPFGKGSTTSQTESPNFLSPFRQTHADRLSERLFPSFDNAHSSLLGSGTVFTSNHGASTDFGLGGMVGLNEFRNDSVVPAAEEPQYTFPTSATNDDVFGLGDFRNVFVTDEDLERAREKLPEEDIKTPEQSIREMVAQLQVWEASRPDVEEDATEESKFESASICFNFIELGFGKVIVSSDGLYWLGDLLIPDLMRSDGHPDSTSVPVHRERHCLSWKYDILSDVRYKSVPEDKALVNFTVSDEHFIQFSFVNEIVAQQCTQRIAEQQRHTGPTEIPDRVENVTESEISPATTSLVPQTPAPRRVWRNAVGIERELHSLRSSTPIIVGTRMSANPALVSLNKEYSQRRATALEERDRMVKKAEDEYQQKLLQLEEEFEQRQAELEQLSMIESDKEHDAGWLKLYSVKPSSRH
ncbi:uncharacterized protein SPPG_07439 [Spizellomyces punctatus DAOM BR117]|uniref:Uncharacterized protein n=1 Tax=Spizellomyces punctatus (strain DAOM BR117) TaxID=645134 RepID=A0A0L0H7Y3_SPIPD|nr:uncharacterized protein SPPG_07439 [Spizellomyces punctatus DAOM BR117]KNC97041.1 hypothetical protein SPPG_07439 [Spizellomyces punctatus DAOM BR117]|eukprot:XP_016605081.1 hypothetical protein SPPG_07439 [Spizellomyces punctatus DAOM BR117]